jgi:hypothetical protein
VNQVLQTRTLGIINATGSIGNITAMHKAVSYQRWFIRAQIIEQLVKGLLQTMRFIIADMPITKVTPAAIS